MAENARGCNWRVVAMGCSGEGRDDELLVSLLEEEAVGSVAVGEARTIMSPNRTLLTLEAIIDSMGDGVVVTDSEGNMLMFNKAAESIYGYSLSSLPLAERVRKFGNHHPDMKTPFLAEDLPIGRATRGESSDQVEVFVRNERRPQGVWVSATARPVFAADGAIIGAVGLIRDITEMKRSVEEHERLRQRMYQTQKLESLGLLAGGVAHDFNNLLMAVIGNSSLALQDCRGIPEVKERIIQIRTAALRLAELTNQLLAYSGRGEFKEDRIDLSVIGRELGELLRNVVSRRASLECELEEGLPLVEADAAQLRQILMTLVANASDALEEGFGRISLHTGVALLDSNKLNECFLGETLQPGCYVFFEVGDTGCGIEERNIQRIFDPFYTTKDYGRGLGLAAVLGLVRRHKGALFVESSPGKGSLFRVYLPPAENLAAEKPAEVLEAHGSDFAGVLLIVDDEEVVREVAKEILERAGFKVLTASGGREGIQVYQEHAVEISAVLLDMTMPDMNGRRVFERLKEIDPSVRVIISSGYSELDSGQHPSREGAVVYLQKPYLPEMLLEKVSEVLGPVFCQAAAVNISETSSI